MKPRARFVGPSALCITWRCVGIKDGKHHIAYGGTWWDSCKRWYETHPDDFFGDIPF